MNDIDLTYRQSLPVRQSVFERKIKARLIDISWDDISLILKKLYVIEKSSICIVRVQLELFFALVNLSNSAAYHIQSMD